MQIIQNVRITSELGSPKIYAKGTHNGKYYQAHATCNENDKWDWDLGTKLAISRLAVKVGEDEIMRLKAERRQLKVEIERLEALREVLTDELYEVEENTQEAKDYIEDLIQSTY